jgi:hypothetical protein
MPRINIGCRRRCHGRRLCEEIVCSNSCVLRYVHRIGWYGRCELKSDIDRLDMLFNVSSPLARGAQTDSEGLRTLVYQGPRRWSETFLWSISRQSWMSMSLRLFSAPERHSGSLNPKTPKAVSPHTAFTPVDAFRPPDGQGASSIMAHSQHTFLARTQRHMRSRNTPSQA